MSLPGHHLLPLLPPASSSPPLWTGRPLTCSRKAGAQGHCDHSSPSPGEWVRPRWWSPRPETGGDTGLGPISLAKEWEGSSPRARSRRTRLLSLCSALCNACGGGLRPGEAGRRAEASGPGRPGGGRSSRPKDASSLGSLTNPVWPGQKQSRLITVLRTASGFPQAAVSVSTLWQGFSFTVTNGVYIPPD